MVSVVHMHVSPTGCAHGCHTFPPRTEMHQLATCSTRLPGFNAQWFWFRRRPGLRQGPSNPARYLFDNQKRKRFPMIFWFFYVSVHRGVSGFYHFRECLPCKTTTHSQGHLVNSGFMLARTSIWSQRGNFYPSFPHVRVRSRATRVTASLWGGQQGGAAHGGNAGFSLLTEASCWEIFTAKTKKSWVL